MQRIATVLNLEPNMAEIFRRQQEINRPSLGSGCVVKQRGGNRGRQGGLRRQISGSMRGDRMAGDDSGVNRERDKCLSIGGAGLAVIGRWRGRLRKVFRRRAIRDNASDGRDNRQIEGLLCETLRRRKVSWLAGNLRRFNGLSDRFCRTVHQWDGDDVSGWQSICTVWMQRVGRQNLQARLPR
ncbi:MAG: hypothetical protein JWS10_1929 [Cypionkella sp.]|nr:hypothetical protein [Cypionkella sp.]